MTQECNILITGANRGIGLEFCRQYADRKIGKIFAVCRKSSPDLEKLDVNIIDNVDIGKETDLSNLLKKLEGVKITTLINNAGILRHESIDNLNCETIVEQFMINCLAPINLTCRIKENLGPGSKVAMITSRMGSIADNTSGGYYGYRMSKTALNMGAKSLAKDFKSWDIAVGLFHPGYVKTDMTNYSGHISTAESVGGLIPQIENLNLQNSGGFWHTNGESLPW